MWLSGTLKQYANTSKRISNILIAYLSAKSELEVNSNVCEAVEMLKDLSAYVLQEPAHAIKASQ